MVVTFGLRIGEETSDPPHPSTTSWVYRPGQFDAIPLPTLLLAGSDSPSPIAEATRRAAAITGAQVRVLDGHAHFAHKTDPTMVAGIIQAFTTS